MKIRLNGRKFRTKEQAHRYLRRKLRLPNYYGKNLDALADIMGERSALEVVFSHPEYLEGSLGDYGAAMLKILTRTSSS